MCDMYLHGFYWRKNNAFRCGLDPVNGKEYQTYLIYLNFKENSHRLQQRNHGDLIPVDAFRCGLDPVNGKACTNEPNSSLPVQVAETIEMLFVCNFPDRESLKRWIRDNYGENHDKGHWNRRLGLLLSRKGRSLLYTVEYCKQRIEHYNHLEEWKKESEYWKQTAEDAQGKISCDNSHWLDHFFALFDKHPNSYWSEKNIPPEKEYQKDVLAKTAAER